MATAKVKIKDTEETNMGISKIDKYKWGIQDEPGNFMLINKNDLLVDHSYQRTINASKTKVIASDWSWIACAVILVAHRAEGMYVIDGQHRVMAARKRGDITKLPCMVFPSIGVIKEAKAFLTVQTNRKAMNAHEKFNALLIIEDPAALLVQRLCDEYGFPISKNGHTPNTVTCVSVLLKHANINPELLQNLWPLLVLSSQGCVMKETVVDGLIYIESQLRKKDTTIIGTSWADRITKIGTEALHMAAIGAAQAFKRGGSRVWALGITQAINKGLQNRLDVTIN